MANISAPKGPDPSGVGGMLFGQLQERQAAERKAKEADVLGSIENKYAQERDAAKNKFAIALEELHNQNALARDTIQRNWAEQQKQAERQRLATGLSNVLPQLGAQAGPLVSQQMTDPGQGLPSYAPAFPITPENAEAVGGVLPNVLREHAAGQAAARQLENQRAMAQFQQSLEVADENDVASATSAADALEKTGGDATMIAYLRSVKPGQVNKKVVSDMVLKASEALNRSQNRIAVANIGYASRVEAARIRAKQAVEVAQIMAKARSSRQEQNTLRNYANTLNQQMADSRARLQQLRYELSGAMDRVSQGRLQQEILAEETEHQRILIEHGKVTDKLAEQAGMPPADIADRDPQRMIASVINRMMMADTSLRRKKFSDLDDETKAALYKRAKDEVEHSLRTGKKPGDYLPQ